MTKPKPPGRPYCKLIVPPVLFRHLIQQAPANPTSPCTAGTYAEVGALAGLAGHQLVGHLAQGSRTTCSPSSAFGIAGALGVPFAFLFEQRVSASSPHTRRSVAQQHAGAR